MKKFLALFAVLSLALASCQSKEEAQKLNYFAQCLNEAGAEYYGAFWCPNCQKQGQLLGKAKDLITHIECGEGQADSQTQLCLLEGIEVYPTWRFDNGTELRGFQTLEELAQASSCPVPGQESVMLQK